MFLIKSTLGTGPFIISKLKEIYTSSEGSSNVSALNSIISAIESRPGAFGGTCVYGYDNCSGEASENYNAPMNMTTNVIRRGVLIKVCRELHSNSAAVTNVLDYCGVSSTSSSDSDFNKVIDAYFPGRTDSLEKLRNQLKTIYNASIGQSMSSEEAWNMVLYTTCRSTVIEKI